MAHVFISYSKKDREYVHPLADKLRDEGFNVWIDNRRLQSSEDWWVSIVEAIAACDAFIIVMSPASDASRWVQREIAVADSAGKPIFPMLLEGTIRTPNWSIFLRTQYEDVRERQLPDADFYDKLAEHTPRSAERGVDVTAPGSGDLAALEQNTVVQPHLANPPAPDNDDERPRISRSVAGAGVFGALVVVVILFAVFANPFPGDLPPEATNGASLTLSPSKETTPQQKAINDIAILNTWRVSNDYTELTPDDTLQDVARRHVTYLRNLPLSELDNLFRAEDGRTVEQIAQDDGYSGELIAIVIEGEQVLLDDVLDQIEQNSTPDVHTLYNNYGFGYEESISAQRAYLVLILGAE